MPVFNYTAKGFHGERYAGTMSAENAQAVIRYVKQNKGVPVAIDRQREHGSALRLIHVLFSFGRIREWSVWCISLSRLLAAGIPVLRALQLLSRQVRSPVVWKAFDAVAADVLSGNSLSGALKNRGYVFPTLIPLMAEAGEKSGKLEEMMAALGAFLQRRAAFQHHMRSVLAYPAVLVVAGTLAAGIFSFFVLPRLDHFYAAFSLTRPPLATSRLLAPLAIIFGAAIWQLAYKPYQLWKKSQLTLFCHTMGLLLQAGINYLDAVTISYQTIPFFPGAQRQCESIVAGLKKGTLLSDLLSERANLFDAVTVEILRGGEESGKLDAAFSLCAEQAEMTASQMAENWMLCSQPVFILLMTLLAGILLYHLILPIFQLALILPDQL